MARSLADLLAARLIPHRFLASQLRRPSGRFGRWIMTRGLNKGNAELIGATLDALTLSADDTFLDIGFGGGLALELAAGATRGALWGVDFSPDVVSAGHRRLDGLVRYGRLNLLVGDVADLPLRNGLVSAVCTTNTIYFWPEPEAAMSSLCRVLAPHGRIAIGFSGADKMRKFDRVTRHGFRCYEPDEVANLVGAAGFCDVRVVAQAPEVSRGDFVVAAVSPG